MPPANPVPPDRSSGRGTSSPDQRRVTRLPRGRPRPAYGDLSRRQRRRLVVISLLRSAFSAVALVVLYFTLPMTAAFDTQTGLELAVGLIVVAALATWQVFSITRSPYPRMRAVESLATTLPLFVLLFATFYYLLDRNSPGSFTEPMTRFDAVYFTVTVFATVGFGDIAAVSEGARGAATAQMIGDIVLVGVLAKILLGAVQVGLRRRATANPTTTHARRRPPALDVGGHAPRRPRPARGARRPERRT